MSSYKDIINSYSERRKEQTTDCGSNLTDLSTFEGRERLRQNMQLADDPYIIEVASPGHIAQYKPPCLPMTAHICCGHLIELMTSHAMTCNVGCSCSLEITPSRTMDCVTAEKDVKFQDTRNSHYREPKSLHETKRTFARPDAALLFDS